jgi:hypothetical protein
MDAILRRQYRGKPVALRVQRPDESAEQAAQLLARAGESKSCALMILVLTRGPEPTAPNPRWPANVVAIENSATQIARVLDEG